MVFPSPHHHHKVLILPEFRPPKSQLYAPVYHIICARSNLFDISCQIHRVRQQRVHRQRGMLPRQFLHRHALGQASRIPHLQPVLEQHHLHASRAHIVAMYTSIHNTLSHRLHRQFILHVHLCRLRPLAHPRIDVRHYERHRLVHHFKHTSAIYLLARQRLLHLSPVELYALHRR